jgi:hypothetical protein
MTPRALARDSSNRPRFPVRTPARTGLGLSGRRRRRRARSASSREERDCRERILGHLVSGAIQDAERVAGSCLAAAARCLIVSGKAHVGHRHRSRHLGCLRSERCADREQRESSGAPERKAGGQSLTASGNFTEARERRNEAVRMISQSRQSEALGHGALARSTCRAGGIPEKTTRRVSGTVPLVSAADTSGQGSY